MSALDEGGGELNAEHPAYKKVDLTPEEYNSQAHELWRDMESSSGAGYNDNAAVVQAGAKVDRAAADSTADVEAPEDVRNAVVSISKATARPDLHHGEDAEKTITLERRADGQIVVTSLFVPGPQGGSVPNVTKGMAALVHVHNPGHDLEPSRGDHSSVKFGSIPSFVVVPEANTVWEVGRRNDAYVQRKVFPKGKVGSWQPFKH